MLVGEVQELLPIESGYFVLASTIVVANCVLDGFIQWWQLVGSEILRPE